MGVPSWVVLQWNEGICLGPGSRSRPRQDYGGRQTERRTVVTERRASLLAGAKLSCQQRWRTGLGAGPGAAAGGRHQPRGLGRNLPDIPEGPQARRQPWWPRLRVFQERPAGLAGLGLQSMQGGSSRWGGGSEPGAPLQFWAGGALHRASHLADTFSAVSAHAPPPRGSLTTWASLHAVSASWVLGD